MAGGTGQRWTGRALRSVLFDVMVSLVVAALAMAVVLPRAHPGAPVRLIGVAMAAVLLVRRRFPLEVTAVVSALALLQVLGYPAVSDPLLMDVAVLIAMYSTVKYAPRLWQGILAAVPIAAGVVIEIVRHPDRNPGYLAMYYLAVCGGTWLGGYTVRTRRLYVAGLEERAATAERERDHLARLAVADERAAIARELHDVVAHSLAVMIVQADGASYALDADPAQARTAVRQVAATGRDALADMGRLVSVLRGTERSAPRPVTPVTPVTLDWLDGLDGLDGLVAGARAAGVPVSMVVEGERPALPAAVQLTVYRLVQEALTNVLRHAGAGAAARLAVRYSAVSVEVEMVDEGTGTGAPPVGSGGHGLVGMRERVAVHGGQFEAGPLAAAAGWRVRATIPISPGGPP